MTKIIRLKTIRSAEEPDLEKRFETSGGQRNFHYDRDRRGWTWGTERSAYPWEHIVDQCSYLFPLTEVEPQVTFVQGESRVHEDIGGDTLKALVLPTRLIFHTSDRSGDGFRSVHFEKAEAAELLEFLNEHVKVACY